MSQGKLKQAQAEEAAAKLLASRFNPPVADAAAAQQQQQQQPGTTFAAGGVVSAPAAAAAPTPLHIAGRGPVGRLKVPLDAPAGAGAAALSLASPSAFSPAASSSDRAALAAEWLNRMRARLPAQDRAVAEQALKELVPDLAL